MCLVDETSVSPLKKSKTIEEEGDLKQETSSRDDGNNVRKHFEDERYKSNGKGKPLSPERKQLCAYVDEAIRRFLKPAENKQCKSRVRFD